ncbi:hypothetical protein [Roseimicrobium sp. ORNL1]|uniref:hypothetical protein n=1 Tax=Roseimicrobium sp. ORNL1 TaxID=2711231 RepID=UPI0013E1C54A|nr:hypothetical protein [Roseimicrobium sp. ORNL1]QIF00428.1 hypothetical protein G5S37_02430 [Roseimicrobium sp. ORNL1]
MATNIGNQTKGDDLDLANGALLVNNAYATFQYEGQQLQFLIELALVAKGEDNKDVASKFSAILSVHPKASEGKCTYFSPQGHKLITTVSVTDWQYDEKVLSNTKCTLTVHFVVTQGVFSADGYIFKKKMFP